MSDPLAEQPDRDPARIALGHENFLLNTLVEGITDLVFFKDLDGRYIRVNKAMAEFAGFSHPDEMIGKTRDDVWANDPFARSQPDRNDVLRTGRAIVSAEERLVTRDGKVRWVLSSTLPLYDELGNFAGTYGIARDVSQMKQVEHQLEMMNLRLQREKALLDALVDSIPDPIFFKDRWGKFIRVNRQMALEAGFRSPAELIGKSDADIWNSEFSSQTQADEQRILETGVPLINKSEQPYRPGGPQRWLLVTKLPWRDEAGNIEGTLGLARDVTDLKTAQERFSQIAENIQEVFWIFSTALGHVEYVSPAFATIWQRNCDELYAERDLWMKAIHADDAGRVAETWSRAADGEYDVEYRIVRPDGTTRWIADKGTPVKDALGHVVRIVGVARDITDTRRAADERKRLTAILDATSDFVGVATPDGRVLYVNQAGRSMAGFAEERSIEATRINDFHPPTVTQLLQRQALPHADQHGVWQGETAVLRADGTLIPVSQVVLAHRDEHGRTEYFSTIMRDISARIQIEDELRVTATELRRSNEELEQFAYVASHDLQEPLRAVSGYCTALAEDYGEQLDATGKEYLQFAVEGARRMQQLIDELLEFSRVGRKEQSLSEFSLDDLLLRVRRVLQPAIDESQGVIEAEPLPTIRGEPVQLFRLFQNLLSNALKYRKPNVPPRIEIGCETRPDAPDVWQFWVRDNGIGIDAKHFERIFQLFQRLHPRSRYPGTGIGLALCKKIVERHGGTIGVESQLGVGSCFRFSIACAPPQRGTEAGTFGEEGSM